MLGFTPLAAAPLSSPGGVLSTTTLASQVITQVVNSLTLAAKANKTITAVSSTFTTGSLGFDAEANVTPSATTASFTEGTLSFVGIANITPSAAIGVTIAGTAGFDAKGNPPVLGGLSSTTSISALDFDAKANITTSSINLATTVVDITAFLQVGVAIELATLLANLNLNLDTPANNLFDYDAVAGDFSRTRTVYILPEGGYGLSKTIYIPQQDNPTISLINPSLSLGKIAHINPENFTLVVDEHRGLPTTVLITR